MSRKRVMVGSPPTNDASERAMAQLADLYAAEYRPMVRLATLLTGSEAAASDAVHDSFLNLHKAWEAGRVDNPGAYLRRAVVNRCHSMHRRKKVEQKYLPRSDAGVAALPPEIDETWAAVQQLPPRQRTVLILRFYEDQSIDQIAELMNIAGGTVKSQLHRGLASLRKNLEAEAAR